MLRREGHVRSKLIALVVVAVTLALPGSGAAGAYDLDLEPGPLALHYSGPVGVVNLYWSTSWPEAQMATTDSATRGVLASDYAVKLQQYNVPGFRWAGGFRAGSRCRPTGLDETTFSIAAFVRCQEGFDSVPAAGGTLFDLGSATMIYNVFVPPSTTVHFLGFGPSLIDKKAGPQGCDFAGYHLYALSDFRLSPLLLPGRPILFTVLPAGCAGPNFVPTITHEIVEAATDPVPAPVPLYWINDTVPGGRLNLAVELSQGEAADICSALYPSDDPRQQVQTEFARASYAGTRVAAYWSNADHACVVGPHRLVWAKFRSLSANGPTQVSVNGGAPQPLPHDELVFDGTPYKFSNDDPPGRRHVYFGDCEGTVPFPGTTDAAATTELKCDAVLQDEVTFTATALEGTAWRVWFNGIPHDGPISTWVADGNPFAFSYEDVPGCTFTGATPASPVFVSGGPVTVTGNYDCGPPPLPNCSTYPEAVDWTHPTAYWRLDDSGPTARDSGPFALDGIYEPGVVQGVPGGILGDLDTAAEFSGSGVVIPSDGHLDLTGNAVSIEVWAKGGPQTPYAYLVSKSDYHGTLGYSLYTGPNGTLRFFFGNGFSRITDETGFVWDGNWHHLVGTYDGSSLKLYVDSTLVANTPASGSIASSSGIPLTIGRWQGGGFTFAGALDEVAVYDHALTADEVLAHYLVGTANWRCT